MAISVAKVIDNARILLQDTDAGGIRWLDAELVSWLNEAAAEIVRIHPHANAVNLDHPLVIGTRQRLPDNAVQLLNVVRNVASDGTPGRVVRIVDHRILDNEIPDWHYSAPTDVIKRFAFDPQDPLTFYVYPASDGGTKVTLVYAAAPTTVVSTAENIPVMDIYSAPLTNYICFRAWLKQVGDVESEKRAASYLQLFNQAMGVKKAAEDIANPNVRGV
jgi:hypothetical protein